MLTGVIEGFYGRSWDRSERETMLGWIAESGMNTFIYGPKDDIHVRARWRHLYPEPALAELADLRVAADRAGVRMMVAIAPCLDITYSDPAEVDLIVGRIGQLRSIGISDFVLLFDDIPNVLPEADRPHFKSFAAAQAHVANAVMATMREHGPSALIFCPTEYCARFAGGDVTASEYLNTLGDKLDRDIGVFWTGPEIVSEEISVASLREIGNVLQRKPIIWENFHANDYDIRRVNLGPIAGRQPDILPLIDGFITNPNNELEANFVPVRTTGRFVRDPDYEPERALRDAIVGWQPRFAFSLAEPPASLDRDQILLLTELFYQPFAIGPEVKRLLDLCREQLSLDRPDTSTDEWRTCLASMRELKDRIARLFTDLTEIENRELFHTLHGYIWEAREETEHLVSYLEWLDGNPSPDAVFDGEARIHNFYRLGYGVAVQEILRRSENGTYTHGRV